MTGGGNSSSPLTSGADRLVQAALAELNPETHRHLGVRHWLLALVTRHGPLVEAMVRGVTAGLLRRDLYERLQRGDPGTPLDAETVTREALERARARGKSQAAERDLAFVVLTTAGYDIEEMTRGHLPPAAGTVAPHLPPEPRPQPRAKRPTPILEQFGRDLTHEAAAGKFSPIVGRDDEIRLVVETLCRRTKRNPALIGPAGVGKTAIVEGVALRIVRGEVPEALRGFRVLAIQPSVLVSGASRVGELEARMKALLAEASQDGIILFIDEVHSVIGAGGMVGTGDVASLLKPALARGDLACIAATTDDEYRRFIEPDTALERRFQPLRVQELPAEQTLSALAVHRDEFSHLRNVAVSDEVLRWLVEFAQQFLRNRYFPDKAVDLLEQCVAYAVAEGKPTVERQDAEAVAQRMVGMPLALGDRLRALRERLSERALLTEEDLNGLLGRLEVTIRGMDLRPARPNAVVLLIREAAAYGEALAETVAASLFGAEGRQVTMDLSRFIHPADLSMLVGAPPGYVGYGDALPLHRVAQLPWCVVRLENAHACHPQVREVLRQALADGFITDASGKRIYLSDTVVVLTARLAEESARPIGFHATSTSPRLAPRQAAEDTLGADFVAQTDLVCAEVPNSEQARRRRVENYMLSGLAERYRKQGIDLQWDESFMHWLLLQQRDSATRRDLEQLVEHRVGPLLLPYLQASGSGALKPVVVKVEGNTVRVESQRPDEGSE